MKNPAQPLETFLPSSHHSPRVSILLVNFNGAKFLPACLDSLAAVSYPNREVILVDNASSDNSLEILRAYPWVKVVRSPQNLGFAGGNNLGLPHCTGEYVLLLNNDTVVRPDFLEPLCAYLAQNPQVGAVQGKMLLPRVGNTLDVCGSFLTAFGLPYHYGFYKPDGPKYQRSYPVFSGKGACLMFRRDLVEKAGGFLFDDHYFCYFEESDFCHRVWLAGYEVHFVPSPPIEHWMGATAGGPQTAFVLRHYLRNMAVTFLGNLSFASRLRILPLFYLTLSASWAVAIVTRKSAQAAAYREAILCAFSQRRRIRERRRLIKLLRRQPDSAIFGKVLRTPRLEYFFKTLTGRLESYRDDDLR